jgi:hypothetical protein
MDKDLALAIKEKLNNLYIVKVWPKNYILSGNFTS